MLGQVVHQYVHSKCSVRLFIYNPFINTSTPSARSGCSSIILLPSDDQFTISSFQFTRSSHPALPLTRSLPLLSGVNPLRSQAYAYHVFISCRFATPSICQHAQPMDRGRGAGGRAVGDVVAQSGLVDAVCGTSPEVTWQRDRDVRSS